MPSDKFKFSAKNGVVAPVIKKLYNSHKKLLGRTSTPNKIDHRSKEIAKPRQQPSSKSTQATMINESHVYENVGFISSTIEKMDSFSEEVFAGVNLSLSSLNLDGESSFSNSINGVDSDISYPGLSSDCSTLTNYDETDSSISSTTCTTPIGDNDHKKDNLKIIVKPNSDLDNVTIIEIDDMKEKLKTAIDNFDKILNEYTPPAKQSPPKPKLQKSKTCSIIESKCILKKTLSDSTSAQVSFNSLNLTQITTKSLCHLDRDVDETSSEVDQKKMMEAQKFLSEIDFWKVSDPKKKDLKESPEKGKDVQKIKVKDVVKRLNSLSSDDERKVNNTRSKHHLQSSNKAVARKPNQKLLSSHKPPLQKSLSNEKKSIKTNKGDKPIISAKITKETKKEQPQKLKPPVSNPKQAEIKQSLIPRAVSCYDVSNLSKKPLVSKIPIKTNLSRTFPSTPGNLNTILDSTLRCTEIRFDDKSQSVQNLSAKINSRFNLAMY
ncbi:hypothetical protein QE152_g34032 [Popillia japonica]|uniref:Uncharacterized protein n=1 Tax=Popillia japonica TaxID=7064 RepID=A0AAW1IUH8_POPJA